MLNQGLECLGRMTDFRRQFCSDEDSIQSISELNKIGEFFSRRESFQNEELTLPSDNLFKEDFNYSHPIFNSVCQLQKEKTNIIQAFKLRKVLFKIERKQKISKLSKKKKSNKIKNSQIKKGKQKFPNKNQIPDPELQIVITLPLLNKPAKQLIQENNLQEQFKLSEQNAKELSCEEFQKEFESQRTNCSFQEFFNSEHTKTELFWMSNQQIKFKYLLSQSFKSLIFIEFFQLDCINKV